jgi:hypothetical protein
MFGVKKSKKSKKKSPKRSSGLTVGTKVWVNDKVGYKKLKKDSSGRLYVEYKSKKAGENKKINRKRYFSPKRKTIRKSPSNQKVTLGGKHISFKKLKEIAEALGIDLVKHTKGYDEPGHTPHKASASTILKRVKDKIKSDGWNNTKEWMDAFIELNKSTAKMPEHLTGMVSTSAMLSPGMMSTPTQTVLDDDLQSLFKSMEGKSSVSDSDDDDGDVSVTSSDTSTVSGKTVPKAAEQQSVWWNPLSWVSGDADQSGTSVVDGVPVVPTSMTVPAVTAPSQLSFGKKRKSKRKVKKSPKKSHKKSPKKSLKKPKRKLYKGSRGGTYYMRKGKKVYV